LNIQNLNWNEDETITLNLNDYCSDYEGKPINFSVANKSNDSINIAVSNGIASFSAAKDWNGNGFIVFKANDGKDEVLTNRINLSVNPVNDAPVFSGSINDFSWNENTNMSDAINLRNYFSDADTNNLELSVSGNNSIQIVINNWLVSFIPNKNWFGTENIVFSVSDGQYRTDSNSIKLNVLANNMPPQFGELNCTTSILEENNYTCALTGSDAENETISFSVIEKNLMNCNINGNVLSYSGSKDYSGSASCVLRISDARGHSDKVLNFQIENVNDAPVINDYFPKNISKIPSNSSQNFRIIASDIDSTFVIQWHLNNSVVGNESSYTLSRESGNYNLTAIVSDGEFNQSKSWIVSFNPINEFTCSEINGNVCTSNQTCPGNLLNVSDSASCCSVACSEKPPKFNDIQKCSTKNPNAAINIIQPSNNQEFKIGNNMTVELEIKNNANQTINFNAEAYVYDLTKDNSAEKEKQTISLGKGESKRVSFVITLSEELNEKNNYAVYAKISDKTNQSFCNDNYVKIGLTRKSYNYAFENVEIQPIQASCGDFVHANVKISNTGANEDTGYIKIENTNLKINEKSDSFTIKSDRSIAKEFELKIPENARAGEYAFIVSGIFNNGKISYEEKIILGECYSERVVQDNIETISLGEESQQSKVSADNKSRLKLFLVLEIFVFIFIISAMLVLLVSVQRKKSLKDIKKSVKKRKK
jgi:hypothetical protein